MSTYTTAHQLVDTLQQAGIERIYGITGDSANLITDAISRSSIRFVHTRHEECAAMAAGAEAQATGRIAACIGSCGPGSLHLLNGLYEANRNGAPVLAVVTEIHRPEIGTRYVQEIDTLGVFRGCSVFCEQITSAAQMPRLLGIAMQTAVARRGVAVVVISPEVSGQEAVDHQAKYLPFYPKPTVVPSNEELQRAAEQINSAAKVAIFAGSGCRGGEKAVNALAAKLKAPLAWSYIGKELFDNDTPYPVGMNGMLGNSAAAYALHNADLLLVLGCGFAFTAGYPDRVPIVQVDINGENLARRHHIAYGMVGDAGATAQALLAAIDEKNDERFARTCVEKYGRAIERLHQLTVQPSDSKHLIYPERLLAALNDRAPRDAWFTADMGTAWAFTGRYVASLGGRRFFTSSLHGTMATALGASIGLKASNPERTVVAVCGDGGLSMLMGDLITLKQEKLNPKIFVLNNSSLDFVAMEMKGDGLMPSFTHLDNPNFAAVAQSVGLKGIRVDRVAQLDAAVDEAMAYDGAVLVDVVVNPNSLLIPPKVTAQMMGHFTTYGVKLAEHGEFEELLEEAVTNVRQIML